MNWFLAFASAFITRSLPSLLFLLIHFQLLITVKINFLFLLLLFLLFFLLIVVSHDSDSGPSAFHPIRFGQLIYSPRVFVAWPFSVLNVSEVSVALLDIPILWHLELVKQTEYLHRLRTVEPTLLWLPKAEFCNRRYEKHPNARNVDLNVGTANSDSTSIVLSSNYL